MLRAACAPRGLRTPRGLTSAGTAEGILAAPTLPGVRFHVEAVSLLRDEARVRLVELHLDALEAEFDLLDSDDYYQFEGGMSAAVEMLSGSRPQVYHNDHSRPERPVIRSLESNPGMKDQFEAWNRQRTDFNQRLAKGDPEAAKEAWQRYYFKGEIPEDLGSAPDTHANKRRLKTPRLG